MKYLTTNQNFYNSKLPLFAIFRGWHEFSFPKNIYVNKATLLIFDILIKFHFLIGTNILQMVFDFIIYAIVTYCKYPNLVRTQVEIISDPTYLVRILFKR